MEPTLLDLDIEKLLEAKVNYHKDQIRFHTKMAAQVKDKIKMLSCKTSTEESIGEKPKSDILVESPANPVVYNAETLNPNNLKSFIPLQLNQNFSVTYFKPQVEDVLKNTTTYLKSEDILKEIDTRYLETEDLRKKAIAVISSSLFALVQSGKVNKIQNEGSRGYLYAWNRN